uniref:Uncharacterized protein n=1 Tax=Anguilla anguilla TaxID=7936 RepID=A0A0E9SKK8_ANGAN
MTVASAKGSQTPSWGTSGYTRFHANHYCNLKINNHNLSRRQSIREIYS